MLIYLYFLPGTFSFVIVITATYVIEKCGAIIGGLVTSMPHIVVINTAFIIINSPNNHKIEQSLFTIPVGIIAEALFLLSWKYAPKMINIKNKHIKLLLLITCSFVCWSVVPIIIILFYSYVNIITNKIIIIIGISCSIITFIIGLIVTLLTTNPSGNENSNSKVVNYKIYICRGLAGMIVSDICGYLASLGYSILTGFMSVFPALFSVTMISLWIIHGDQLQVESAGALLLGITGVNIFVIFCGWLYLYLNMNICLSLFISWLSAWILGGIPMLYFMKYINKRNQQKSKQINLLEDTVDTNEYIAKQFNSVNTNEHGT